MNKCLIITSYVEYITKIHIKQSDYNLVICADGGLLIANYLNLNADILIGDYDSMAMPNEPGIIKLPTEKDMTDTEAALDLAITKGYINIDILGGLGGRFDHTMGNIGLLNKYAGELQSLRLYDGLNLVSLHVPDRITIDKENYKYLSLISYDGASTGITLTSTKYPLSNASLSSGTTLGVSNEIIGANCQLSFETGKLLVILSNDVDKKENRI